MTDCFASANALIGPTVGSANSGSLTASNLTATANFGQTLINQIYLGCALSAGWQQGQSGGVGENSPVIMPSYCTIRNTAQNSFNITNASTASMFLKNMLPLMTVMQFLFIALAPLAAFTLVMAGSQGMGMFIKCQAQPKSEPLRALTRKVKVNQGVRVSRPRRGRPCVVV